jgi:hypothetical protein
MLRAAWSETPSDGATDRRRWRLQPADTGWSAARHCARRARGALEGLDVVTSAVDSDLLNHIAVSRDLQCSATEILDPCCDGLTLTEPPSAVAALRFAVDRVEPPGELKGPS